MTAPDRRLANPKLTRQHKRRRFWRWCVAESDIRQVPDAEPTSTGVQAAAERLAETLGVTRAIAGAPAFDRWLPGYLRGHPGCTVTDGVAAWLEQEGLVVHLVESEDVDPF